MLGIDFKEAPYTENYINTLLEGLYLKTHSSIVLTGVCFDERKIGAAVYDGENIKLSLNGSSFSSVQVGTLATSEDYVTVGWINGRNSRNYIKSLHIYNEALSLDHIKTAKPTDDNVEVWFDFNDYYYSCIAQKGDVNADGKTDICDLVRLKKMSVGIVEHTWRGDVNADASTANAMDLSDLRKKLLGLN